MLSRMVAELTWGNIFSGQPNDQTVLCPPFVHLGLHLSSGLVLASCLILGVSVSSFVYRRQAKDPTQAATLLFMIVMAIVLGLGAGASANLILLGWLPWAAVAAMATSVWHSRSSDGPSGRRGMDEKSGLSK